MADITIFKTKDCDYEMELVKCSFPDQIRLRPSKLGTGLSENDVIKIIAELSKWLNERRANEA
jgi:hypothetical protein